MCAVVRCILFVWGSHYSAFHLISEKIQSITSQYHRKQSHRRLFAVQGFHHPLICIYCKSMCECCVARHVPRCVFCRLLSLAAFFFFFFSPTPSPLLPLLLVNRRISIFISGLPQLLAVKCLQASFFFFLSFFLFFSIPTLYLSLLLYSVLGLVSCTKKVTWPLMSYMYMSGTRQKNPLYHYYYYQQATFWMYLYSFG